jgi:hypothetical protein
VNFTATQTAVPNVVSVLAHGIGNTSHIGDVAKRVWRSAGIARPTLQGSGWRRWRPWPAAIASWLAAISYSPRH